jgi:hypothetical protein
MSRRGSWLAAEGLPRTLDEERQVWRGNFLVLRFSCLRFTFSKISQASVRFASITALGCLLRGSTRSGAFLHTDISKILRNATEVFPPEQIPFSG